MKFRNVSLMFLMVLLTISALLYAQSESPNTRTIFGARLDKRPIPDFIAKHLGLSSGQGFRIVNLHSDGPAHKAGLEKDDILVGFRGQDITDADEFVDAIRQSSPDDEVKLDIIHLGKPKTVEVKLGLFEGSEYDWVYPMEPEFLGSQISRPGRAFRMDREGWVQVPLDQIPQKVELKVAGDLNDGTAELLTEIYSYYYSDGDNTYTIAIEGNPNDDDSNVFVRIGDTEYKSTVKRMENLPGQYRAIAEEALQDARKSSSEADSEHQLKLRKAYTPSTPRPEVLKLDDSGRLDSPSYPPATRFAPGEQILNKIEKQIIEMQQRLEKMEKLQEKMLEQLSDELKT
jgi:membrane-associated protease RseP (regulator of RpoE activity)